MPGTSPANTLRRLLCKPARAGNRGRGTWRKGAIFITALWITLILTALVLVFARSMHVELIASANRSMATKVDAIELGAEQYVLAQVDDTNGDASYITSAPAQAIQVGDGYFWIIRPDALDVNNYDYGIEDEASKLNINTATSAQLLNLPNMTQDVSDSVVDWRSTTAAANQGAQSSYYETLPNPYHSKGAPFDTVEELLLVKGVTMDLMYGADKNHNRVIDQSEEAAGGNLPTFGGVTSPIRGIFPYLTCFSIEPNTDSTGAARVNVNGTATAVSTGNGSTPQAVNTGASASARTNTASPAGGGDASNAIRTALQNAGIGSGRITQILGRYQSAPKPFNSVFDFANKTGMTQQELAMAIDKLTTSAGQTTQGLVNVNTAPEAVLMSLPGLEQSDAETIIAQRASADISNMAWLMKALTPQKLAPIGNLVTGRSYIYSADIVAVSHDGRAFKRVRIVVDGRNSPPQIIYRRELTSSGWPLPQQILDQLRAGQPIQTGNGITGNVQGGTAGQVQM